MVENKLHISLFFFINLICSQTIIWKKFYFYKSEIGEQFNRQMQDLVKQREQMKIL